MTASAVTNERVCIWNKRVVAEARRIKPASVATSTRLNPARRLPEVPQTHRHPSVPPLSFECEVFPPPPPCAFPFLTPMPLMHSPDEALMESAGSLRLPHLREKTGGSLLRRRRPSSPPRPSVSAFSNSFIHPESSTLHCLARRAPLAEA